MSALQLDCPHLMSATANHNYSVLNLYITMELAIIKIHTNSHYYVQFFKEVSKSDTLYDLMADIKDLYLFVMKTNYDLHKP